MVSCGGAIINGILEKIEKSRTICYTNTTDCRGCETTRIFVTGGMGYIGSHTVVQLLKDGHQVLIYDNLSNSSPEVYDHIAAIAGKTPQFIQGDVCDAARLNQVFAQNQMDAVLHFAGLKSVAESSREPLRYYNNNVCGTLTLLETMARYHCRQIIFSSSATVYGDAEDATTWEDTALSATNPYGYTKLFTERIFRDLAAAEPGWNITLLRYFNPIGAHESGLIGERPSGKNNNLLPNIAEVACGRQEKLQIFGGDYPTADGTGVRDYIHVCDLAHGHVLALAQMKGLQVYNLGTGKGYSVLDVVRTFERVNGVSIPYVLCPRRPGDVAARCAAPEKAQRELGFRAVRPLDEMCRSAYQFALNNG